MSLGLANAKLGAGGPQQRLGLTSRKHRVTTSVAEQAVFIPKPHKRVTFKMNLPGSGQNGGADSLKAGQLGDNGVTARFNRGAYMGAPSGYVKMEVDMTPTKQTDVIATQEEGRQVNRGQTHFTQQYDNYGRPRIGFSREPYDFAATKYVSVTNQIAFQQSMANMHSQYNDYLLTGEGSGYKFMVSSIQDAEASAEVQGPIGLGAGSGGFDAPEVALMGNGEGTAASEMATQVMGASSDAGEIPIFGSTSGEKGTGKEAVNTDFFLGSGESGKVGSQHHSAQAVFDSQKGGGASATPSIGIGSGDVSSEDVFNSPFNAGDLKTVDVTA